MTNETRHGRHFASVFAASRDNEATQGAPGRALPSFDRHCMQELAGLAGTLVLRPERPHENIT